MSHVDFLLGKNNCLLIIYFQVSKCEIFSVSVYFLPYIFWSFLYVCFTVEFMRSNIVGTVIILSLLLWIPASCTVSYVVSRCLLKFRQKLMNTSSALYSLTSWYFIGNKVTQFDRVHVFLKFVLMHNETVHHFQLLILI